MSRKLSIAVGAIVIVVLLMVAVGVMATDHSNPPVTYEINWDSPKTEALARTACYDCHSNETVWPWYSYIAPFSLFTGKHVVDGRQKLNFSTGRGVEAREMIQQIQRGTMPETSYILFHPEANLSQADKDALIAGLEATFPGGRGEGEGFNNRNGANSQPSATLTVPNAASIGSQPGSDSDND